MKAAVNGFIIDAAGPAAFNSANGAYIGILDTFGVGGFAAMVGGVFFITGVVVHRLWVKADWKMRRWGADRTAKDLGASNVREVRQPTPANATTRPEPEPEPKPAPTPQPAAKEKPKEEA